MEAQFNYMSPGQLEQVISAIPELKIRKWNNLDVEYLFKNSYWMALRANEAMRLKKEDFNFKRKQVFLGKTKTVNFDFASIPDPYIPELTKYLEQKEPGLLMGKHILEYDTYYLWLKRLGKLCDVEAWTEASDEKTVTHIFRKSIGKDMLYGVLKSRTGKKFEIPIISKQLRHSSVSTTQDHYLKAGIEQVKQAWTD